MKEIINRIFGTGKKPDNRKDMKEVMRRVDEQVGRAVTRLSER